MFDKPLQIVLDTNVLVSAMRSRRGSAFQLISLIDDPRFKLNLSVALAFEYEAVLKRPETVIPLTVDEVDRLIDYLCSVANLQPIFYLWRPKLPDPNDDFVLELALASSADYIVTFNSKDFLLTDVHQFKAVAPAEFLRIIGDTR